MTIITTITIAEDVWDKLKEESNRSGLISNLLRDHYKQCDSIEISKENIIETIEKRIAEAKLSQDKTAEEIANQIAALEEIKARQVIRDLEETARKERNEEERKRISAMSPEEKMAMVSENYKRSMG